MSNDYEARRLQQIQRNQFLISELGLGTKDLHPQRRILTKKRNTNKLAIPAKPARVSARIASAVTRPTYTDDSPLAREAPARKRQKLMKDSRSSPTSTAEETPLPSPDLADIRSGWTSWRSVAPPPSRDVNGTFHFESHPDFTPNKSPVEMLSEGAFGGSYYRPIYSKTLRTSIEDDWEELPDDWLTGLNVETHLTSPHYDAEINKFRVKCGQSIEEWEAAGWISHSHDVRGWFQWYTRFFMGRRCDDDDRQVGRWQRCVGRTGRWRRMLLKKYLTAGVRSVADEGMDDAEISPVMHQTCHQWGCEIRQQDLDDAWNERT